MPSSAPATQINWQDGPRHIKMFEAWRPGLRLSKIEHSAHPLAYQSVKARKAFWSHRVHPKSRAFRGLKLMAEVGR